MLRQSPAETHVQGVRACLQRSRSRCEPPPPQVEHGESAPRLRSLRQGLTGLAQPPRALEPAEGAFDAPAPWPARHPAPLPGAGPEAAGPLEPRRAPRAERARVAPRGPDALPAWTARAPGWHDLVGPRAGLAAGRLDQPAAAPPQARAAAGAGAPAATRAAVRALAPPVAVVFPVCRARTLSPLNQRRQSRVGTCGLGQVRRSNPLLLPTGACSWARPAELGAGVSHCVRRGSRDRP